MGAGGVGPPVGLVAEMQDSEHPGLQPCRRYGRRGQVKPALPCGQMRTATGGCQGIRSHQLAVPSPGSHTERHVEPIIRLVERRARPRSMGKHLRCLAARPSYHPT